MKWVVCCLYLVFAISAPVSLAARPGSPRTARATATQAAPTIDGRLDDAPWQSAAWHSDFTQRRPLNGVRPSLRTRFAVLFDHRAIYIAVRCAVPNRELIISRLIRRDRYGDFDRVSVTLSPRNDGLTGYKFNVNPHGVQSDAACFDDGRHDRNWDAVWQAETDVSDSEWTVEMAIPFDQMRFTGGVDEWGFQIERWISARQEGVVFNPIPLEQSGWISAAGRLIGMKAVRSTPPLSITPESYASYRAATEEFGGRGEDGLTYGAGGYAKIGLGTDLVLDLAINPDFGQVEVDEAVLNLSDYETRFPEKRPFFLEGAGLFATPIQLFYSRRLGAPPPDPELETDDQSVQSGPTTTPILSAVKVTGRSAKGLSVGLIQAALLPTQFEVLTPASDDPLIGHPYDRIRRESGSPWTSASVVRLNVEPTDTATFGVLATALNPQGSHGSYGGGVDWNVFDRDRQYSFRGQLTGSLRYDGVLGKEESQGVGLWTQLAKRGGEHLRVYATYDFYSDGFDVNDMGFLRRDDLHRYNVFLKFQQMEKVGPFAQIVAAVEPHGEFNTRGLDLGQGMMAFLMLKWLSDWVTEVGGFGLLHRYDDRETRGGPPLEKPRLGGGWLSIRSAQRKMIGGNMTVSGHNAPHGYSAEARLSLELRLARLALELGPEVEYTKGDLAYVDTLDLDDPASTTVIGQRELTELELALSGTVVLQRNLTLQLLGQLLVASADYSDYQLLEPDSSTVSVGYDDDEADFVYSDLRLQALLRWEYLPGSALYAVYTHFGFLSFTGAGVPLRMGLTRLDEEEREQFFMLKVSHRFG